LNSFENVAKKILLTGASGFVGQHLIQELSHYELHAISTSKHPINSITRQYTWAQLDQIEGNYDAVIHMAGLAHDTSNQAEEQKYFEVNQGLTQKLIDRAGAWNITTFIYLSSVKAAVDSTSDSRLTETLDLTPGEIYGRSKRAAEEVILSDRQSFQKVILRPVMIYGKGQKGNLVTLEKIIRKGLPLPIRNWKNKRSVLFIGNLTYCIRSIVEKQVENGVYYVADDDASSTADLINHIGHGINIKPRYIPFPNAIIQFGKGILPSRFKKTADKVLGNLQVDNSKLRNALALEAMPFTTEEGFKLVYN